jgi:acyl carrier protein
MAENEELRASLKKLIVESLNLDGVLPETIEDEEALFDGRLGLDSVDALELVLALERAYGLKIESGEVEHSVFATVAELATFVACQLDKKANAADGA